MKWHTADKMEYAVLKENSKFNRRNMTEAESAFWEVARSSRLGKKCRRQYVIGPYIVDFFFRESMVIVEIDGDYHFTEVQMQEDIVRQEWLELHGYKVLRFKNNDVLFDIDNVIKEVKDRL